MNLFVLNKKDLCLCGSGKKYKHCCFKYTGLTFNDYCVEIDKCNYKLAYNIINSELTKYLIYVKRHTIPMLNENSKMALPLLKMDIEAVGEYLDKILFLIKKPSINADFAAKARFITSIVNNYMWRERISSFILIYYYIIEYDEVKLLKELENNNVDEIADIELIKIMLDIKGNDLGIGQELSLIERIIDSEKDEIIKSKYQFQKSLLYFFNNDKATSQKIISEVVTTLDGLDILSTPYHTLVSAQIYSFVAQINSNKLYFDKAISLYTKIVENKNYTNIGKANIAVALGHVYFLNGDNKNAVKYLEDSKRYTYLPIADIYLAFVELEREDYKSAEYLLSKINYDELSKENAFDYLFAFSLYILKSKDLKMSEKICSYFNDNCFNDYHYFDSIRMDLLLKLKDLSFSDSIKDEKIRLKWLDILNRAIMLQPNIAGIGINFNYIIDKLNKK